VLVAQDQDVRSFEDETGRYRDDREQRMLSSVRNQTHFTLRAMDAAKCPSIV
jgi:hypothetical protein